MTDYAADSASSTAGTTLTVRTGTASGDTVPAGSYVIWQNTGAGVHVVSLTNNYATDTGVPPVRSISIPAGGFKGGRVNSSWGDASGRVAVAIDGTPGEVKFMIPGGI
jgi:hypothetical protein